MSEYKITNEQPCNECPPGTVGGGPVEGGIACCPESHPFHQGSCFCTVNDEFVDPVACTIIPLCGCPPGCEGPFSANPGSPWAGPTCLSFGDYAVVGINNNTAFCCCPNTPTATPTATLPTPTPAPVVPQPPTVPPPLVPCLAGGIGTAAPGSIASEILRVLTEQAKDISGKPIDFPTTWPGGQYNPPSNFTPNIEAGKTLDRLYEHISKKPGMTPEQFQKIVTDYLSKPGNEGLGYRPPNTSCSPSAPGPRPAPPTKSPPPASGGPKTGQPRTPNPPRPIGRPGIVTPPRIPAPTTPPPKSIPPITWNPPSFPKFKPPSIPSLPPRPPGLIPGIIGAIPTIILDPILDPGIIGGGDLIPGKWHPPFQPPRHPHDDWPIHDDGPVFEPPGGFPLPPIVITDPKTGEPIFFDTADEYLEWSEDFWNNTSNFEFQSQTQSISYLDGTNDQTGMKLRTGDMIYVYMSYNGEVPVWPMYLADFYPREQTTHILHKYHVEFKQSNKAPEPNNLLAKSNNGDAILDLGSNNTTAVDVNMLIDNNTSLVNASLLEMYGGNPPVTDITVLVPKE